jgi:hypothetical protein
MVLAPRLKVTREWLDKKIGPHVVFVFIYI